MNDWTSDVVPYGTTDDLAVVIRDEAVRILIERHTLAGHHVEAERVDPIESGDMPRIAVFGDTKGQTDSAGGTAPAFGVTLTLAIDCFVEQAQQADAVREIDLLVWQVKEALLGDGCWVKLSENIRSLDVTKKFRGDATLIIGEARVLMTCTWRETYRPRIHTPLATITFNPLPTTPPGATPIGPPRTDGEPTFEIILPTDEMAMDFSHPANSGLIPLL